MAESTNLSSAAGIRAGAVGLIARCKVANAGAADLGRRSDLAAARLNLAVFRSVRARRGCDLDEPTVVEEEGR